MWKFFSRGLRETLERRVNFSRQDKAGPGQDYNPISAIQNKLIPGIISAHNFDDGKSNLGGRCDGGSCNDKKQNNRDHGERWKESCHVQHFKIFGAIGWSGVMVLGWYLCQPACRRRRHLSAEKDYQKNQPNIRWCHTDYVSLITLLSRTAFAQPLGILPQKPALLPPVNHAVLSDPFVKISSSDETDNSEDTGAKAFGPATAEQALDEAAVKLESAQKSVLSEIEHRLGMACMQLGKNKEAVTHFERAMELDYAPAAFNLGLCYETGRGTSQDLKLAAEYYELASQWGHATAMYNLGVFYVHGWGGVSVDHDRAKQLFTSAAELGQINAKEALAKVTVSISEKEPVTVPKQKVKTEEHKSVSNKPNRSNVLYTSESKLPTQERTKPLQNASRKPNATETFYQLLGIKNSPETSDEGVDLTYSPDEKDIAPVF